MPSEPTQNAAKRTEWLAVTPLEKLAAIREWIESGIPQTLDEDPSGFLLGIEAVAVIGALRDIEMALR